MFEDELNERGVRVGSNFVILGICEDNDLLEWYEKQDSPILSIQQIDYENGYIWTSNCPYAIWVQDIELIN